MDAISKIETAIFNALCTPDIVGMVGFHPTETTTVQIYNKQGKSGATYPLVTFSFSSGGRDNSTQRYELDLHYLVSAYALDGPVARKLFGFISDALSNAQLQTGSPLVIYDCREREYLSLVENIEGNQYYREAAYYEIKAIWSV